MIQSTGAFFFFFSSVRWFFFLFVGFFFRWIFFRFLLFFFWMDFLFAAWNHSKTAISYYSRMWIFESLLLLC